METYLIESQIKSLKNERQYLVERKNKLLVRLLRSGIKQFDDEICQYNLMIESLESILKN